MQYLLTSTVLRKHRVIVLQRYICRGVRQLNGMSRQRWPPVWILLRSSGVTETITYNVFIVTNVGSFFRGTTNRHHRILFHSAVWFLLLTCLLVSLCSILLFEATFVFQEPLYAQIKLRSLLLRRTDVWSVCSSISSASSRFRSFVFSHWSCATGFHWSFYFEPVYT